MNKRNRFIKTTLSLIACSLLLISFSQPLQAGEPAPLDKVDGMNMGNPLVPARKLPLEIPTFDKDKDEYVLLSWNNLGMHCISDSDPYWILLPPANDIFAQLVKRGDPPEIITEGVEISYAVEKGFEHPEKHVRFWEFADKLLGADLKPGVGVGGLKVNGIMKLEEGAPGLRRSIYPGCSLYG